MTAVSNICRACRVCSLLHRRSTNNRPNQDVGPNQAEKSRVMVNKQFEKGVETKERTEQEKTDVFQNVGLRALSVK